MCPQGHFLLVPRPSRLRGTSDSRNDNVCLNQTKPCILLLPRSLRYLSAAWCRLDSPSSSRPLSYASPNSPGPKSLLLVSDCSLMTRACSACWQINVFHRLVLDYHFVFEFFSFIYMLVHCKSPLPPPPALCPRGGGGGHTTFKGLGHGVLGWFSLFSVITSSKLHVGRAIVFCWQNHCHITIRHDFRA